MTENADNRASSTLPESDISALFSSPDSLSKISEILSKHGILENNENRDSTPPSDNFNNIKENTDSVFENSEHSSPTSSNFEASDIFEKLPHILTLFSSVGGENSMFNKQQNDLLRAIRPFLSERRREVLDGMMKFERVGAMLNKLTQGEQNVSQQK